LAEVGVRRALSSSGADAVRGITLVTICFLLFTIGDVATVWAVPVMGAVGAMLGRGVVGGAVVVAVSLGSGERGRSGLRRLAPVRAGLVAFRSVIHALGSATWYIAWQGGYGLADSYAVNYATPLLVLLLAVPMLGEHIGWRRGLATLVGFAGMLVMLRPGGDLWQPLTLLLLLGVASIAVSRNLTRVLATTETPECLAAWLLAAHLPVGVAMLGVGLPVPGVNATVVVCVLVLGVTNGLAHWLHARACALAQMGVLAPFEYTTMIWGVVLGYVVFAQVPSWSTIAGAAVVVAAGLLTVWGEQRRSRAERVAGAGGALSLRAPAVAQPWGQ
jgi:drug/metabolite transporter (DMT)-like permease